MSGYLYALGGFAFRHKWRVLISWLLALVVIAAIGSSVMRPFDDEFKIPGAESMAALDQLRMTFPEVAGTSATLVVVAPDGADITDPGYRKPVDTFVDSVGDLDFVEAATDPYDDQFEGVISDDSRAAIVNIAMNIEQQEFSDAQDAQLQYALGTLRAALPPGATADLGGEVYVVELPTLSPIESLGVLVALVVLAITLGSIIAAGMPILTALLGVAISMTLLLVLTALTEVNSTTPMLAVMLGLAVGIDYALFILSRHRNQLAEGMTVEESAARAVATAGSAVVFAGLTVIIALCGLALANLPFLTVMGGFAAAAVAVAVLIASTLLPALMGFANERMRPRQRPRRASRAGRQGNQAGVAGNGTSAAGNGAGAAADSVPTDEQAPPGFFRGWVRTVTKVPLLTIAIVVVALGALALPTARLALALPDAGQKYSDAPDRITYDRITDHFGPGANGPLIVTAQIIGTNDPVDVIEGIEDDIAEVPGVKLVPLATPNRNADTGFVQVVPQTGPADPRTKELVQRLRDLGPHWEAEYDVQTAVTGNTAAQIDITDRLASSLLPFGIFVVGLSLILLTMIFRSLLVPIKASLGFLLSVGAALGATTLVFNEGNLGWLVNLEQPGPVISFFPIMLMGILFGLAMDYEVFLVSRMREEYTHGRSAKAAVERGFVASAPVVVAAAVIMFAVFAFFVPASDGAIKSIAFGLAVGILVDAFVVRMILVPAVLALLGDKAWWLPRWLDRLLPAMDIEGDQITQVTRYAEWPASPNPWNVYAERYAVAVSARSKSDRRSGGLVAAEPVNLQLSPAQVLVVEGEARLRTPLLLGLAGRMRSSSGRARVAGALLPQQAGLARANVELVEIMYAQKVADDLQRADGSDAKVIIIDGADRLTDGASRDRLGELVQRVTAANSQQSLLLGAVQAAMIDELLPDGYHHLALCPAGQVDQLGAGHLGAAQFGGDHAGTGQPEAQLAAGDTASNETSRSGVLR